MRHPVRTMSWRLMSKLNDDAQFAYHMGRNISYEFYRHLGWKSTGVFDANSDEVLELILSADD